MWIERDVEPLLLQRAAAEAKAAYPNLAVEEFLVRGGFPELYANPDIESEGFLRSYVATYLERDLRQLLQVSSLRDYEGIDIERSTDPGRVPELS